MKRLSVVPLLVLLAAPTSTYAQNQLSDRYEDAFLAWDNGHYIEALELFIEIVNTPGGDRYLEDIALITGELYQVTEVAPDGRNISISPDGDYAAFEVSSGNVTQTYVVSLSDMNRRIRIDGGGLTFSPAGDLAAYLKVIDTPELLQERQKLVDLTGAGDRTAMFEQRNRVRALEAQNTRITILDISAGRAHQPADEGLIKTGLVFSSDGKTLYALAAEKGEEARSDIYAFHQSAGGTFGPYVRVTAEDGYKSDPVPVAGGKSLIYTITERNPIPQSTGAPRITGSRRAGGAGAANQFAILDLSSGEVVDRIEANRLSVSADGSTLISMMSRTVEGIQETSFKVHPLDGRLFTKTITVFGRIGNVALSPDGKQLAYQIMLKDDWEIFVIPVEESGGEGVRLTREIQHDLNPLFLDNNTILAVMGESRHRRSYLYDITTLKRTRLFHNNTVRTIAPEYEWKTSADGRKILIVSERDGDTISPERGIYLVDLEKKVSRNELLSRLNSNLESERSLRSRGELMFAPIADEVRKITERVSMTKIYEYQKTLFDFDSKYIGMPGNQMAADYIFETLKSFGYEPEYQWFEPRRDRSGETMRTANVIAVLEGTENPELIYVLSSHYDSVSRGPGADDNTSGIATLLEAARVLARNPMPATIIFAAFTGEEAGLLGSREFIRRSVENGDQLVGALNNDMFGWSNDHHLDNTIRYSNAGIRDVQHASAFLFSELITYDAHYFKGTDAAAYYDAYGDIIGGIGSYPVLGSPYYHQPTDVLQTINHELIVESCKTTVASLMLLASSPSRLKGLEMVNRQGSSAQISWEPSPEKGISSYIITYGPDNEPALHEMNVTESKATLPDAGPGTVVAVKAVNSTGLSGWDWVRLKLDR